MLGGWGRAGGRGGGQGGGGGGGSDGGMGGGEGEGGGGGDGGDILVQMAQPAPYEASQESGKPGLPINGEQREVAPSLMAHTPVYDAVSPAASLAKPR